MAFNLDTNILLSGRGPDVAGSIGRGLQTRGMFDQLQQQRDQAPIRQQLLEDQQAEAQQVNQENQAILQRADQGRVIDSIAGSYKGVQGLVNSGKFNEAAEALTANREVLRQSGITNFDDTDTAIAALTSGDPQQIQQIKLQGEQAIQMSEARRSREQGSSAADRAFENQISGFTDKEKETARRIKAGLTPRAVGSSAQTIAAGDETSLIAESQGAIEEGKSKGKAIGKAIGEAESAPLIADTKAGIETAVTLAKEDAESRGEALTELQVASASMPALITVVDELKQLAPLATSTIGGNVFDFAVKEIGFGATEGSTAKAKFSSVINNQILPLLKQTFGAAFTKAEGDELKATMGNVDAAPAEKIAQLNSFIDGKIREIQTKERQLGQVVTPSADITTQDTGITAEQFRAMTPAQRAAALQQLGGGR